MELFALLFLIVSIQVSQLASLVQRISSPFLLVIFTPFSLEFFTQLFMLFFTQLLLVASIQLFELNILIFKVPQIVEQFLIPFNLTNFPGFDYARH
jgi:hypothetical protein